MAWADVVGGVSTIVDSPRESDRFGVSVARLSIGGSWPDVFAVEGDLFDSVRAMIDESTATVVIVRSPSRLMRLATEAVPPSRRAIPAGVLMYWQVATDSYTPVPIPAGLSTASSVGDDPVAVDRAIDALNSSFSGYSNHYDANPLLARGHIEAGYLEWAKGTANDADGVIAILRSGDETIGVATAKDSARGTREIELAGIVSAEQGRGLYRHLLDAVVVDAAAQSIGSVVISTQSHNIAVQRAWAAAGFKPVHSVDTIHFVREDALRERR